ncbi:helix-turn-helix domain-containing protein [Halovenus sp. HT40]|uniref:helix-turn-helix domain-containing protein n=1 Tax=Halovenus sp. HT40 TaxID=3126691 RepID=UPI00300F5252
MTAQVRGGSGGHNWPAIDHCTGMRYLELSFQQPPDARHPMHEFVAERDEYTIAKQMYRHQYDSAEHALLFHIDGPEEPYRREVASLSSVIEFEITPCSDDSFYLYIREEVSPQDRELVSALSEPGLILVQPIEFRTDKTVRLRLIGPADAIQTAADNVPEANDVEILQIGEFRSSRIDTADLLTDRQHEAVTVAVEAGYYDLPQEVTLDHVASQLGCSTGTAGELLRRAEHHVMTSLVSSNSP